MRDHTARALTIASLVGAAIGSAPELPAQTVRFEPAATSVAQVSGVPAVTSRAGQLLNNIIEDQRTLGARLAEVDARLKRIRLRSIARGRAYVRMVRSGLLPAAAGLDSLIEHASRVEGLKRAIDRDLALERELLELKAKLLKKVSELDERLSAMQAERQLIEQNKVALESARDRALAFEQAFSHSPSAHTAVYGAGIGPDDSLPEVAGFAALKGRLPFPLTGRSEVRPAKRRAASGPALEMLAPAGSVVQAVYPGTVAFADEYADYGKTIIVDHADGYFTVSANLGSIKVKVGEDVGSGSQLATLGGAGSSALYFEIRQGTDTLDPAEWFGI